mgnify:CR=1 FL=1
MISVLDPPRVEAEPTQPLPDEKPHRVDITFRTLSEAPAWDSALTEWTGFAQDPATQVGLWCRSSSVSTRFPCGSAWRRWGV